jgi:hypothetical protein
LRARSAARPIRRALDQTNWEAASEVVAKWTASGQIGVARLDIPDIKDAVDKYFEDAKARQLRPGTISKHSRKKSANVARGSIE